ncbi:MAG: DegQ family serine endoprotease [Desulfobacteraceae bacterium]|jgi:serine protease Do|nr:DegQ family serine endoprotease [Desulfobacteraceae bacterium]
MMHQATRVVLVLIFAAVLAFGPLTPSADARQDGALQMIPSDFSALAAQVRPGVVNIRTVKTIKGGGPVFRHFFGDSDPFRDFFGPFMEQDPHREFKQPSLGSGFIIDREGYIVTNNHVVEDADNIKVRLASEKEYEARIVGRDPNTDLALIKIDDADDLAPLTLGDSDSLKVGTWVMAVGSPFGLEQTVTAGIVSAKGRIIGSGPYDDFIQTDASINPGNSGGPLINLDGEVVGINTAIVASGQGIGFAIPVNMAKGIIDQLKESGTVTRGWLGVGIQNLTPELAEYYGLKDAKGVLVVKAYPDDPAAKAGIRENDIIVAVADKPVEDSRELSRLIAGLPVGEKIKLRLIRDGKPQTVQVTLAKREDDKIAQREAPGGADGDSLGMRLGSLDEPTARRFGFESDESGALVTAVDPNGKAAEAGVRPGDLIKELNRKPVESPKGFADAVAGLDKEAPLELLIKRPGAGYLALKIQP